MAALPPNEQTRVDMERARANTSFDVSGVRDLLHGSYGFGWEAHAKLLTVVSREAVVNKAGRPFMSREERYKTGQAVIDRFNELRVEHGWSDEQLESALLLTGEILPSTLHATAFLPVILRQGSDEQVRHWGMLARARAIIGCYAQTELGHGTDVAALETTATFDKTRDEFVLHSPTLTSTKWWIGGLGRTATHAVVQAQLVLEGKRMGPHLFIVQLRSLEDHKTLPGRTIGDIGPKAFNAHPATDHGFLRFDHVRIPRAHMLSKFAQVTRDATYVAPPHAKLSYGGMLYIRAQMNLGGALTLAKAITISVRYCTVRRQGRIGPDGLAPAVVSYPSTYHRLLPVLAKAYVFNIVSRDLLKQYDAMSVRLAEGDASLLPETHVALAGMKVLVSADVLAGIDTARRAMGGHGFSEFAGVGALLAMHTPAVTYEGDNYVLDKQVVRAALKAHQLVTSSGATPPRGSFFSFLATQRPVSLNLGDTHDLAKLLQWRAAHVIAGVVRTLHPNAPFENDPGAEARVSRAVTEAFIAARVADVLARTDLPGGQSVRRLLHLYLLTTVETALADLATVVDPVALRAKVGETCKALLPDAIGLTDAFGFTDWELDSVLGVHDGGVYDALWERARKSGFNDVGKEEQATYKGHISAVLRRGSALAAKL
ncbi:acyl-CoA oxidase [Exidia glandulosa HHB12029]|uniref:Acyl-coenzyme A oxidase n=1 Tax=Exidia glandulosa HHB12029 TaxID=1314781 RepID=A0A165L904_EXIGL|nr:acyl-CoA oxidase [Exidia glandulosa HHB12029]